VPGCLAWAETVVDIAVLQFAVTGASVVTCTPSLPVKTVPAGIIRGVEAARQVITNVPDACVAGYCLVPVVGTVFDCGVSVAVSWRCAVCAACVGVGVAVAVD